MRRILPTLVLSAFCVLSAPSFAQDWKSLLTNEQVQKLSPEAAAVYHEAADQADHVNYDEAVRLLAKAAEIDFKNIDLQFLAATRARNRADTYYGEAAYTAPPTNMDYSSPPLRTAEQYFNIADACLNRIAVNSDLPTEQRNRLRESQRILEARRAAIAERDAARFKTGAAVTDHFRELRYRALIDNLPEDQQFGTDEVNERIAHAMGLAGITVKTAAGQDITPPIDDLTKKNETVDPFAVLPGEFIASFLPPPPAPTNANPYGQAAGGGIDPFANTALGGNPPPIDGGAENPGYQPPPAAVPPPSGPAYVGK